MSEHTPSLLPPDGPAAQGPTTLTRRPPGLTAARPSFARLVRVELRKAVDTRGGRWLSGLTGLLVLAALAISMASTFGGGAYLHTFMTNALVPVALLVPLMGLLLMTGEFSTRTLLVTFALVPTRGRVVAAKSVAAILVAVAFTVVGLLLSVAAAGALALTGESVRWSVEPAVLIQLVALQVINVLVGVGFGLLLQSTTIGVIAYLVVPFVIGLLMLMPALSDLAPWLDLTTGTAALSLESVANPSDWLHALSVTGVWAGVPFLLGWLRLRRREIA